MKNLQGRSYPMLAALLTLIAWPTTPLSQTQVSNTEFDATKQQQTIDSKVSHETAISGPLSSAFERMNHFSKLNWSYQKTTQAKQHKVELYNPSHDPVWTLLAVEGETPSKKQQRTYRKEMAKLAAEKEKADNKLDLHEIIDIESLTLVEKGGEIDKYSFKPIIDDADFDDSLTGQLWHNKKEDFIEQFGFHNTSTFSPMLGVKIKTMRTSFMFKEIGQGVYAPDQVTTEVAGRAFGIKEINHKELQTYQMYSPVTTK